MVWQASPRAVRALRRLRFCLLAFVAVFAAHDGVFFVQYGFGQAFADAMRAGGHDGYWPAFTFAAAIAAAVLGGAALLRVAWLRHRLGRLRTERGRWRHGSAGRSRPGRAIWRGRGFAPLSYRRELIGLWARLFVVVTVVFVIQENVEHAGHHHLLGLGALWSQEYPLALPALAGVTLVIAAIGALVRWRIAALHALVAGAAPRVLACGRPCASRPGARWWVAAAACHLRWTLARQDPGRAPPARAAACA